MTTYKPTKEQQKILEHNPKQHARILAGPGTGKSATVVALLDTLLKASPDLRVKLLTFTRAATAELAKKVSAHPAAATQRPSTIHSFSNRPYASAQPEVVKSVQLFLQFCQAERCSPAGISQCGLETT